MLGQVRATQVNSLQTGLFWASRLWWFNLSFWTSDNKTSFHTVLGFPRQFFPATCPNSVNLGSLLSDILQTWPYHLSLLCLNWESTEKVSHFDKMSWLGVWSSKEIPQMRLRHLMWNTDRGPRCLFSKVQVSPAYSNTDITIECKNCNLTGNDTVLCVQTFALCSLAKAPLALATLWATSASMVLSEVTMLPKYLNWELGLTPTVMCEIDRNCLKQQQN